MMDSQDIERPFDVERIREDFPLLSINVNNKPLVYLDNSSTTQKPLCVIDAIMRFYKKENANVHRGIYKLSEEATFAYEKVRGIVKNFINARKEKEIIFVRGTTEAINLVANTLGYVNINENDEIILSEMEHHSNIVPWQILAERKKARIRVIPMNNRGELDFNAYLKLLNDKTKLVGIIHVSNVLGTVNPIKRFIDEARGRGIVTLVDAAQSVSHIPVDVQELGCDFLAFSGHKLFGPTGIGILYGREEILSILPPYHGGGDMIKYVTFEKTTYQDIPFRFEAGTPNIAGALGLGESIRYINSVGMKSIMNYENKLLEYALKRLPEVKGLKLIGTSATRTAIFSFIMECAHPHDIGTVLDSEGVAIRTGHHCAQPIMDFFCVPATARASFSFYNTFSEVDTLINALNKVHEVFR